MSLKQWAQDVYDAPKSVVVGQATTYCRWKSPLYEMKSLAMLIRLFNVLETTRLPAVSFQLLYDKEHTVHKRNELRHKRLVIAMTRTDFFFGTWKSTFWIEL